MNIDIGLTHSAVCSFQLQYITLISLIFPSVLVCFYSKNANPNKRAWLSQAVWVDVLCSGARETYCKITVLVGYQHRITKVCSTVSSVTHWKIPQRRREKERGRLGRHRTKQAGMPWHCKKQLSVPVYLLCRLTARLPRSFCITVRCSFAFTTWPFV